MKHPDQRVGIFVDVANLYHSAKNLYGARVNFGKLLEEAVAKRKLVRAMAYAIRSQSSKDEDKFFEILEKQGFELRMKDLQVFAGGAKKGDWDIGMAVDIIRMSSKLDVAVIVTGDGDFIPLVEYVKHQGPYVELMAFGESTSAKLIETADEFIDLSSNKKQFLLPIKERKFFTK
ncbi:MAG: NYN domain-containing protein [Patescibacteria group bacterium]|jgi:uncharacterized LabA/DUF88 family protein